MALRIRRGTESQRTGVIFNSGELVWTTDLQQLWVGDGVVQGGVPAVGLNITGYGLTFNASSKRIEVSGLTTDDITQSVSANNRWFTTELAQDAVAPMFTGGTHSNISFQYDDALGKINATVTLDGIGLNAIQDDTIPSLGGNLTLNTFDITGTGDISITGTIYATSTITSGGTIDAVSLTANTITASTGLGGDLSLNSHGIIGTGDISITGTVTANLTENLQLNQVLDVANPKGFVTTTIHRGTFLLPTAIQAGDELGGLLFKGYTDTLTQAIAGLVGFVVDPTAVIAGGNYIKTQIIMSAASDTGQDPTNALVLNSTGVVTSNAFVASKYNQLAVYADNTARDAAITAPIGGMMVFNTGLTQFQGYNGSAWVALN